MNRVRGSLAGTLGLFVVSTLGCQAGPGGGRHYIDPAASPDHWRTKAERTDYQETDRYDDIVVFCRRLADAAPEAHYTSIGLSGEGRGLPLLILSRDRAFTPEAARATGKPLVLVQNCIHSGECAGKDASLELARDILVTGTRRHLLDRVNLLILPIFSVDGHERFGPYNRINQIGPQEMGWRVNASNLNLNRDYTKADAVEMRAWLRTWVAWQPDLFFDNHATDGSDHQYTLLYSVTANDLVAEPIADWVNGTLLPNILPALEADGHNPFPYGGPRNPADLSQGIQAYSEYSPRFSTGYAAICNRASILVAAHARKPYARRVRATYDMMRRTLEELNRDPEALCAAVRAADERARATRGGDGPGGEVVLTVEPADNSEPLAYKSVAFTVRKSDITGGEVIVYSDEPITVQTRLYNTTRVAKSIAPPVAYVVPPQWTAVIDRLELHGIEHFRLARAETLDVASYHFADVTLADRSYEGRQLPTYRAVPVRESRALVAGTVIVPLDQPRAKVAVHLLEPDAPDSLVAWGLLNVIFERKEYAADYVLEPIARRMLAEDPELQQEFEARLAADEEFVHNPWARLNFFYSRTPYWDQRFNVYPIARLEDAAVLNQLRREAR